MHFVPGPTRFHATVDPELIVSETTTEMMAVSSMKSGFYSLQKSTPLESNPGHFVSLLLT